MVLVMVVPTLAPMIMGTAPCNEIDPVATSATTIDVVAELLCMIAVNKRPINNPAKGLAVARMMTSVMDLPACCSAAIIRSSEKRKINNAVMI